MVRTTSRYTRGIDEADVKRQMKEAGDAMAEWLDDLMGEVEDVVEDYIEKVFDEALRRVPVRTGNLRSTIEIVMEDIAAKAVIEAMVGTKKTTYAAFVEFGTKNMSAQPYLVPALKKYIEPFVDAIRRTVKKHAKKAHTYAP